MDYTKSYLEYREKKSQEVFGFRTQREKIIIGVLLVGLTILMVAFK
jgi:hypothetical protein